MSEERKTGPHFCATCSGTGPIAAIGPVRPGSVERDPWDLGCEGGFPRPGTDGGRDAGRQQPDRLHPAAPAANRL